ncbi:aryldialkylphosphatase [Planomonospora venezuelensis]|uniref:Phosphotriesterase-related protein n=1 Tax=Planomonospora venezuelensis TaxID=1999 RepID=A0A841D257_PLAVE|nr:aryldialkylphosphatase [Planomonospora venezuelensis]MBB5961596.1 phosphotriesterase-related protein [Planomonospora venezuelensis]GIM98742.1 aryldialkylphosphatase [Planomonospora venezuelensis]
MPDAPLVRTLTGPVPPAEIDGSVLPGERLRNDMRWAVGADSDPHRWLDEEQAVTAELRELRQSDRLGLVVELSAIGTGRDAAALARTTAGSRVSVVAGTGFFAGPFNPSWALDAGVDELTRHLMTEIGEGLDGTSARPGVIGEIGAWTGEPSGTEERCAAAAARASLASGLPVAVHHRGGLALLEILLAEGLPAARIAVGDTGSDPAVTRKVAEAGGYVRLTSLGGDRLRDTLDLIEAGHAHRLLLSSGVCRVSEIQRYGGPGYGHLFRTFLPRLREAGITEETIRLITHDNPLRWLAPME